ncbi:MAG TPA: hypothetical protein V6C72_13695, partial [Chroococcales cyanobacterium]
VGGASNSGIDNFIEQTTVGGTTTTTGSANTKISSKINQSTTIYEIRSAATFAVGPFLDMHAVPFIGDVPLIGKSATITIAASRAAEYPEGLSTSP